MPILRTVTLGCKVNQYETEYLREGLSRLGYRDADGDEPADLCVVNTCTVTAEADLKSRKAIRRLARRNPDAEIVVTGCYATRAASLVAELPGVVEVITDKRQLPEFLARRGLVDVPTGITRFGRRHRAYVKVQDGCTHKCSYCIIPHVRGTLHSRPLADILQEVGRLVDGGHREIVLTGIHLGHYGLEPGSDRVRLASLVEQLADLPGEFRIRISSIEAAEVTPELVRLIRRRSDRICPHLHISMQSGSDAVLRRMQRRWDGRRFVQHCLEIAETLDRPALTTDVIVGFPGETEADFEATCRAVEAVGFSKVHVFRFSPRDGTPAARMPDQIPTQVKQHRGAELALRAIPLRRRYFESLLGRDVQVLVESAHPTHPGRLRGTSGRYVPVEFDAPPDLIGRLVTLDAQEAVDDRYILALLAPAKKQLAQIRKIRSTKS